MRPGDKSNRRGLTDSVQLRRIQQDAPWTRAEPVPRRIPQLHHLLQRLLGVMLCALEEHVQHALRIS